MTRMPDMAPPITSYADHVGVEHIAGAHGRASLPFVDAPTFDGGPHPFMPTRQEGSDDFNCFTIAVQNNSGGCLVLGEDPQRRKARIWTSSTGVVLGKEGQVASGNGAILLPNFAFEFTSWKPLYANLAVGDGVATGSIVIISVIVERDTAGS